MDTGYRYLSKRDAAARRDQGKRPDDRDRGKRPDDTDQFDGRDPREGMDTGSRYGQVPVFKGESEAYQREMQRQEQLAAERSKSEAKAREMEESSWRGAPDRDRRKGRN